MNPPAPGGIPASASDSVTDPGRLLAVTASSSGRRLAHSVRSARGAMRALQLEEPGVLGEVERPIPQPKPDEVLVRTLASTICTSDLNDIAENPFGIALPRVLGHEAAGIVAAMGENVDGFQTGDAIAAHPVMPCEKCSNCRRGLGHLCLNLGHLGLDRDGTFAEYFCVRADRIRRVPAGFDPATAALLEPTCVCLEALERARLRVGETLLIVGDGPFGLLIAELARRYGPRRIVLVGHHEFRLRQTQGAIAINARRVADPQRAVLEANEGDGVDAAILAVAAQAALDLCVSCLRARGRAVVFSARPRPARLDLWRVHIQEIDILGACNDEGLIDVGLERLLDPEVKASALITHRLPFAEWRRALELARRGKDQALKVAMLFGGSA